MTKIIEILMDIRQGVDWAREKDIIENGLLDSFDMITLIGELNDAFDVSIGLEHMEPENFNSVEAIASMLRDLGADL
jgi:acyl carrier protein